MLVMSLKEARNNTTSLFSFLIGTMSSKHQKGEPVKCKLCFKFNLDVRGATLGKHLFIV